MLQALQGFQGYAGGLDTLTGQTGSHTVVASYMGAKVCFDVTSLDLKVENQIVCKKVQMSAKRR